LTFGVPIKCKKYGLARNNNCIEGDYQYSRKLEKNCRGNKDIGGISAVDGKENKWVAKEKRWITPAKRAKIKIKVRDKCHLLNLIKKGISRRLNRVFRPQTI
jgi:hypothetical protein